jgi:uncharacterized protein YkwD
MLVKTTLKPFCVHPALQRAARAHSKDMIQHDYFSHYTRGRNEDPCTRIRSFGYGGSYCAENIGYNAAPEGVFHSWMRSSIHRPNILDGRFHENRYRRLYGPLQRLQDYHVYYGLWCPC